MKPMFLPATFVSALLAFPGCASSTPSPAQQARLGEAQRLLQQDDPDGALAITDALLREQPDWREARLLAADGSLRLAQLERPGARPDLFLADAVRDLEKALRADDQDAASWLRLAEAHYRLGQFASSRDAAEQARSVLTVKQAPLERVAPAIVASARAELQLFVAARQAELRDGTPDAQGFVRPGEALARQGAAVVGRAIAAQAAIPDACTIAATALQWLGQDQEAIEVLQRGIRTTPTVAEIHLALQELQRQRNDLRALAGAYATFVREAPGVPMLLWYQGRAQVMIADQARSQGNFQAAMEAYQKAGDCYGRYRAMVPDHAAAAGEWLAIAELSIARVLVDMGDLAGAEQHLFASEACSPKAVEYDGTTPALVDSFGSHYAGVVFAINRTLSQSGEKALAGTLAFNRRVLERQPDKFGFVYNNAALAARDLGVQQATVPDTATAAEREAALKAAMALWEQSYAWYEKAARLSPDDPRIQNDCGLMLIYHLNRDFDRAKAQFERAIAVGQPQLDALPADADTDTRNFLEEAVGDAWQNLAVLAARHRQRPAAEWRPLCAKAITYYPGQQREAARMLAEADGGEPQGKQGKVDKQKAARFDKARQDAEAKAKEQDLDGALAVLDEAGKDLRDYAPFQQLKGDLTLRLANSQREAGKTKGLEFLYADAVAALKKSVELDSDPAQPRLLLATAYQQSGDAENAARTATALLLHLQSQGGGKAEELDAIHQLRADAAARAYIDGKKNGKEMPELLADARTSFRQLEQKKLLDAARLKSWAALEQWAGAAAEAVNIHARALQATPDDPALIQGLCDTAAASGQATVAIEALKSRTDAFGLWFLGRCHYLHALELQNAGKGKEALPALDAALAAFEKSKAGKAEFADSCAQWIAMCTGKKGNLAFQQDDLANAEKWLLESARLRPDRIQEDLGNSESTKLGILKLADKYLRGRDLGHAEAIARAAAAAADADLDLLNNAGLFARDFGNAQEGAGKKQEAAALYEQSYKAYTRAQQLDSKNVRLRNDRALILVHHLEREWDTAKDLLESAIKDGEQALKDNPPATPQERNDAEEAVGDCYENLALWHLKHAKDGAAAKAAAENSLRFHPGKGRPGARRHLAAAEKLLQGK